MQKALLTMLEKVLAVGNPNFEPLDYAEEILEAEARKYYEEGDDPQEIYDLLKEVKTNPELRKHLRQIYGTYQRKIRP